MNKTKARFIIYTSKELNESSLNLETLFNLKIERSLLEKMTPDGIYYDFHTLNDLLKAIDSLKRKYEIIKIVDKEGLLKRGESK